VSIISKLTESIPQVDHSLAAEARAHLDRLTKPPGSLGRLEDIAVKYCCATGSLKPVLGKKIIFTFASDHGVAAEGVSAYPKEVTPQMVMNMLAGGAAVNVLAAHAGAEVRVVDIGVDDSMAGAEGLIRRKIRSGSGNISKEPAMTMDEAERAIEVGAELAREAVAEGAALIGTGEMGIANTTPSAALFAALLAASPAEVTGRGTGIGDESLSRKIQVIEQSLSLHKESLSDPLQALAAVGGLEIAGICGLILGAASSRVPVVVDGFISSAGALVACQMCERVKDYLFFSHCSDEAGHKVFFSRFGAEPILDMALRLGEGTGAALAMPIIEAAVKIYNEMATFGSAGVSSAGSGDAP
jgi:nicotinate-nucleotide--dimethylbenzimidazole phosphoribosyltransferase